MQQVRTISHINMNRVETCMDNINIWGFTEIVPYIKISMPTKQNETKNAPIIKEIRQWSDWEVDS